MKKLIKTVCGALILLCVSLMSVITYGFYTLPDEIYSLSGGEIDMGIYSCSFAQQEKSTARQTGCVGEYKLNISLFNTIPVKISNLTVSDRKYVVPSGEIIGLRIFTKGVMIVATDYVDTRKGQVNPAKEAKLQKGDVIYKINGNEIENSTQVEHLVTSSNGQSILVEFTRKGESLSTEITPVHSVSENKYKTGLWIRDSAAGIGTMTFYEKNTGFFACLGHAVCDTDTGEVLPLSDGDIVDATISGCVKGRSGVAGELCGNFKSESLGSLIINNNFGVYGYLNHSENSETEIPVAIKSEITTGSAQIIATIENETKKYYDIEIEKLNLDDKDGKNMVIKIKDKELIDRTGGIVQGMSGSPIIQNGRLVGAVTHVFLNDPTRGYGICAETMFNQSFKNTQ